ncbi:MAG: hypothetical protein ACYC3G_00675 [Minisyncoccota bacterium]
MAKQIRCMDCGKLTVPYIDETGMKTALCPVCAKARIATREPRGEGEHALIPLPLLETVRAAAKTGTFEDELRRLGTDVLEQTTREYWQRIFERGDYALGEMLFFTALVKALIERGYRITVEPSGITVKQKKVAQIGD